MAVEHLVAVGVAERTVVAAARRAMVTTGVEAVAGSTVVVVEAMAALMAKVMAAAVAMEVVLEEDMVAMVAAARKVETAAAALEAAAVTQVETSVAIRVVVVRLEDAAHTPRPRPGSDNALHQAAAAAGGRHMHAHIPPRKGPACLLAHAQSHRTWSPPL